MADMLLDPRTFGLLNIGFNMMQGAGPSKTPQSFGSILGGAGQAGLQSYMQANEMQQRAKQAQLQESLFGLKMQEAQREAEERARKNAAIADLTKQFPHLGPLFQADLKLGVGRAFPEQKAPEPFTLSPGAKRYGPDGKVIAEAPTKAEGFTLAPGAKRYNPDGSVVAEAPAAPRPPSSLAALIAERDALPDGSPLRATYDQAITRATTHQPAASVNVNTDNLGLKPKDRFDMEGKLRGDYRANPTVKAADEMDSAFKLIEAAYKQPSAANDLAMATKYMKILDPTSVVRESEFALAVNATGLFDKVQNYAASVLEGKKLNPAQRQDFYNSAKSITESFAKEREKIAKQFEQNATQYNLTPTNVIGGPPVAPSNSPAARSFDALPPAVQFRGKTIRDTTTGKLMRSDGMSWKEVKQ